MEALGLGKTILVLDGGFSNELNKRTSFDVNKVPLWTAEAIHSEPETIVQTHIAYLEAGVDIIETSTYQATLKGFKNHLELNNDAGENLIRKAVRLAKQAVAEFKSSAGKSRPNRNLMIAGSIGPYGVVLHDGSEYTGNYMDNVTKEELIEIHLPRLRILVEEGVDLLAFETIPSLKEAEVLMELVNEHFPSSKAWVSLSVRLNDENRSSLQTAYGESLITAYETLTKYSQLWGFGINCCAPHDVTALLTEIKKFRQPGRNNLVKLIIYPNTGQAWSTETGWINEPNLKTIDTYANEWMSLGADVLGGCCQVGPDEIKKIRDHVDAWNSKTQNETKLN